MRACGRAAGVSLHHDESWVGRAGLGWAGPDKEGHIRQRWPSLDRRPVAPPRQDRPSSALAAGGP